MTYTAEVDRAYEPVGTRYQSPLQDLETWNVQLDSTRKRVPEGFYRPGAKRVSVRGAAAYLGIGERCLRDRIRAKRGPDVTFHEGIFAITVEALFAYAEARGEGPKA